MEIKKKILIIILVTIVNSSYASDAAGQRKFAVMHTALRGGCESSVPTLPDIHRKPVTHRRVARFYDLSRKLVGRSSHLPEVMEQLPSAEPERTASGRKNKKIKKRTLAHLSVCAVRFQDQRGGTRQYITRIPVQQPHRYVRKRTEAEKELDHFYMMNSREREANALKIKRTRRCGQKSRIWHQEHDEVRRR